MINMQKRVKVFASYNLSRLEENINIFLESIEGSLHSIEYQHNDAFSDSEEEVSCLYSALLIFTPKQKEESNERKEEKSQKGNGRIQIRNPSLRV